MEHLFADFQTELTRRSEKSPVSEIGLCFYNLDAASVLRTKARASGADQPRVRERIMKLSKVYSATCHHRYSSER